MKKSASVSSPSNNVKPWTDEEMGLLYALREDGIPYKVIALQLKRSTSACEKKYRSTFWSTTKFYDPVTMRMKDAFKRGYLEQSITAYEKRQKIEGYKTDLIADRLVQAVSALPSVPKPVYTFIPVTAKKTYSPEDVGLMLSDVHIGHHHTYEETGGLSEYNFEVFKRRAENLKKATAEIVELHSKLYKLPTLHLFCIGDIVAGMNNSGSWSPIYINMPIYDQMIQGYEAIADMIHYWLGIFDNIVFYGVMGNHGRGAPQGSEKEYVNWDYICYNFLEARLKGNPRVKFVVPRTWWILQEIRNHKFLLVHGEDVKAGSMAINGLKNYEQKMMGIIKEFPDYTLAGHFHSAAELTTNHGRLLINGSFVGADVFSLKDLQNSSKPEQKIFGIHDKRGITWSYNLDLDDDR